jgi:hypothetical protein
MTDLGMKTSSRGQGRAAVMGFESGPLLPTIRPGSAFGSDGVIGVLALSERYFTTSTAQGANLTRRSVVPPMIRS